MGRGGEEETAAVGTETQTPRPCASSVGGEVRSLPGPGPLGAEEDKHQCPAEAESARGSMQVASRSHFLCASRNNGTLTKWTMSRAPYAPSRLRLRSVASAKTDVVHRLALQMQPAISAKERGRVGVGGHSRTPFTQVKGGGNNHRRNSETKHSFSGVPRTTPSLTNTSSLCKAGSSTAEQTSLQPDSSPLGNEGGDSFPRSACLL